MIPITTRQKFYLAAACAALILTIAAVDAIRSRIGISRLEREAATLTGNAKAAELRAAEAEARADRHAAQAEYLEHQLTEFRDLAAKQDEQIKKLGADTGSARGRVDRARRIRTIESTAAAVCEKLKDLGHGCDE